MSNNKPQVDFYMVAEGGDVQRTLCSLINKAYQKGFTVLLNTADQQQAEILDSLLWTQAPSSFIPHRIGDAGDTTDTQHYPVQLMVNADDTACAGFSVVINSAANAPAFTPSTDCQRLIELVDGNDGAHRQAARQRFKDYRAAGLEPTFTELGTK